MTQSLEWISIKDMIPAFHEDVLIYFLFNGREIIDMGYRESLDEDLEFYSPNCRTWCVPTHWMKLPSPPIVD